MASTTAVQPALSEGWTDEEIVARVLNGETELFQLIMRRHNLRLYRVAFSILPNDADAEDVMEEAYVRAYQHLEQFAGRAKFSTWLTRIAVNEALMRKRRSSRHESLDAGENPMIDTLVSPAPDPEERMQQTELAAWLENAILALPERYRLVFILRDVQELDGAETAACLGLSEANVKVRLHRARAVLRRELSARLGNNRKEVFPGQTPRWDDMDTSVLARLRIMNAVPALRA